MSIRKFKRNINRGLGSAIVELKRKAGHNEKYREAVLYACTHDTCYDAQSEDGRQYYLYEAIELVGGQEYFLQAVIGRMKTADGYNLIAHLAGLLYAFWTNGYDVAGTALLEKFDDYLSKIIRFRDMEKHRLAADTLTLLALWLCDIYGIRGFYRCAEQVGQAMHQYPDRNIITLDWLISGCKDKFGRSFMERFEEKALKSDDVRVMFDQWKQEDDEGRLGLKERGTTRPDPTLDEALLLATEGQRRSRARLYGIGRRLADDSASGLRLAIAGKIDEIADDAVRAGLMRVFRQCDYPYPIEKLLRIYEQSAGDLKVRTLQALARFTDRRVHAIAVENLERGVHIDESMELLINNFDNDGALVHRVQKSLTAARDTRTYHDITMSIRDIFERRKDKKALEILLHCYRNGRCSFCRTDIVEIMCKRRIIPDDVLEECFYDCVEDTRKLAGKYKRKMSGVSEGTA